MLGVNKGDNSFFVCARAPLSVGSAAAAIIILDDGRYLLQLRDDIEQIWYPGHWGCFGGSLEAGEDPIEALRRELREELNFALSRAHFFMQIDFDLGGLKLGKYYRKYYVVPMLLEDLSALTLREGSALEAFHGDEVLSQLKLTPYDAFALFLHARSSRLVVGL